MMRGATILWAVLAAIAGTGLFLLKYEVQTQEGRLSELRKEIADTRESIHVLKAEWSYLNDPLRLREQAERHLRLHPLKPTQMVTIDSLPMAPPPPAADAGAPATGQVPAAELVPQQQPAAQPASPAKPAPSQPAAKPKQPMLAAHPAPAKPVKVAALAKPTIHKPAAAAKRPAKSATVVASLPARRVAPSPTIARTAPVLPASPSYPATPASVTPAANDSVMVIKSPALIDQEMASMRTPR